MSWDEYHYFCCGFMAAFLMCKWTSELSEMRKRRSASDKAVKNG